MIRKEIISLIYEAAAIQRWNDHIRPWTGFTELDKQAHKMFYAYVLAKCEGDGNFDPVLLIEGGIFEFFHRIIVTDIKPPIYHKLIKRKGVQLNNWVLSEVKEYFEDLGGGFYERMEKYYNDENYAKKEKSILKAAHYCATNWEFNVIYPLNALTFGIEQVKKEMTEGLAACDTFSGFKYFMGSPYLNEFLSLIGKLRYQQRWSKASRIPATFVMGHMIVVAILSYFCALETGACKKRAENDFFAALFHDLPEALTRDIVSPVKASVKGLDDIIRGIEEEQMEEIIFPLLPKSWHDEIKYFTNNEFSSKIKYDGDVVVVTSEEINEEFNSDKYSPIDGEIIRACDHISAYMEAYLSLKYGIRSEQMVSGYDNLAEKYKDKNIAGINFGEIFDYFKLED